MSEETITVTREHYERLKSERLVLFGANHGIWTDEELERQAVEAAVEGAGQFIESSGIGNRALESIDPEQFRSLLQQACWKYMETYVNYIPF